MSDEPTPRHDSQGSGAQGPGASPAGYRPPQFVPPPGSSIPAPPLYDWNQPGAGQYGAGQYSQPVGAPYLQPASPYGQAAYYGMQMQQPKGLSIASMVCGIASVLLGWFMIPQIAAIITGHLALRREPTGKGMSITGLVLGYLCLLCYGAIWLFLIIGLSLYSTSGYRY